MKRLTQIFATFLAAFALTSAAQNSVTVTLNGTTYTGALTAAQAPPPVVTPPAPVTSAPQLPKVMMTAAWPLNQPATNFPDETRSLLSLGVPTPITSLLQVFGPNHIRFDPTVRITVIDSSKTPNIFAPVTLTTDWGSDDEVDVTDPVTGAVTRTVPSVPIVGCKIEGVTEALPAGPPDGDRHCLIYDAATKLLHELDRVAVTDGVYSAVAYRKWDTTKLQVGALGQNSADAAGLPILPLLTRYAEVATGSVKHALRFTVSMTRSNRNNGAFVPPASHAAGNNGGSPFVMGGRFRLRAGFPITGLPPIAVTLVNTLKSYGLVVADNGITGMMTLDNDSRWSTPANTAMLLDLSSRMTLADFIPVNSGPIIDSTGAAVQ